MFVVYDQGLGFRVSGLGFRVSTLCTVSIDFWCHQYRLPIASYRKVSSQTRMPSSATSACQAPPSHTKTLDETLNRGVRCGVSFQESGVSQGQSGWSAYLAYLFFPPLYLAGPIITFNAFASQVCGPHSGSPHNPDSQKGRKAESRVRSNPSQNARARPVLPMSSCHRLSSRTAGALWLATGRAGWPASSSWTSSRTPSASRRWPPGASPLDLIRNPSMNRHRPRGSAWLWPC